MNWIVKHFETLTLKELYDFLTLRSAVFVLEQECPYQDVDGKDEDAYHVMGYEGDNLVAYCRLLKPGISYEEASIGRVIVKASARKSGLGKTLMNHALNFLKDEHHIRISAQAYLKEFYSDLGFEQVSEIYLEDNIPHIEMLYKT
ncbi:MAG: GNAT family N-acetyltransferase [Clostridia bacterium]|nr:GNAT family N-acetyltransferase [Clostridia bacterium]